MANSKENEIYDICLEKVESLGFEIEYVEKVLENSRCIVRIVIDKKNKDITTDDCELVSKSVEDLVDKVMESKEYVLEISSAGLERNLKSLKLFKKYIGKKAYIKLFKKTKLLENIEKKEFEADILDVDIDSGDINFKLDKGEIFSINFVSIASAHTVFDFDKFFSNSKDK